MLDSPIMLRALAEVLLLAAACGPLGVWILLYRQSYAAESLSHAMLPGLVVAVLAGAPLLHSKTCRSEPSLDSHFIAAEHPEQPGVWLLGGGSGHGFKHGPAMAERLAPALRGEAVLPGHLALGARVASDALFPIPADG